LGIIKFKIFLFTSLKENNLISESEYKNILDYEKNLNPSQKSKVAKAITLIGSLFLLSGLLGTLPLIWDNLTYWAQLLLLIVTTFFLIYAANYSEKFEDRSIFIFKSSERVSSVLYLISTISFGSVAVFTVNIINRSTNQSISEDFQIMIVSFFVTIYSLYLYTRTRQIFQHVALFYSTIFFLGSVGNIIFPNIEPWAGGLFLISIGLIWGLYTFNEVLGPSWLGYFLSTSTISIGSIILIDNLFILQINNPPAWDQGYHLSNVFKMYNILGDQGINISEKSSQLLNVTDSYRGPLTYFLSALFMKVFSNTYQFAYLSNQIFNLY